MKPIIPHLLWASLAVGAFAFGRTSNQQSSAANVSGELASQTSLSANGSTEGSTADSSATKSETTIREVTNFIDQFRVSSTGKLNPEGMADAVQEAIRNSDRVKSSLMFAMLMDELTPENAQSARDAVSASVSGWDSFRYLGLLNYRWGEMDGEGAVDAASQARGRESGYGTVIALSGWAKTDPDAAMEWINSKEDLDGPQRNRFMRGAISGIAASDADAATKLVEELAINEERGIGRYVQTIAREKIKEGSAAAEQWMASLSTPELRSDALGTILDHMRRNSTDDARNLAIRYANEPSASDAISDFAYSLTDDGNTQEAIDFASALPAGKVRNETIRGVYSELTREDPELVAKAISKLQGSERDLANSAYASNLRDGAQGFEIAATIADPELQRSTLVTTGSRWLSSNPEEAAEVIALQPVDIQNEIVKASDERNNNRRRRGGR